MTGASEARHEFATIDERLEARGTHPGGVEAIPTPGHTDNNTCYLVNAQSGETYLFVGDVLFPSRGIWQAAAFIEDGGDKDQLKASLELLSELSPDVVLFSTAVADPAVHLFTPEKWRSALVEASCSLDHDRASPPRPEN
ncbi:MBL fold metallo-hydrolase [Chelativorans salis]|uniref:MBL fold metallo-hydrolase n=1 Tax=Chelativorans salis TaxID=2978478 RepID=A0ABT2LUQ4_9HYPH|nr:MBL fold metallo-hydrolase [Chelativorans sp. EGI FJ00035]MCT7378272.1 MBL fold metallo-hydrolase [Chelativorans sp. EGI FJ00035]